MENITAWIDIIIALLAGLATAIPLVVKLIQYIKIAVKEKNWNQIVNAAMQYMVEAEGIFEKGEDKKAYVMNMVALTAQTINYDYDAEAQNKIGEMIDTICDVSKKIVKDKTEQTETKK